MNGLPTGLREFKVDFQALELEGAQGWVPLGTADQVVDLTTLFKEGTETLLVGTNLPPGHYTRCRLWLGTRNSVTFEDGSIETPLLPLGLQAGIILPLAVDLSPGGHTDLVLDFDGAHSLQVFKGDSDYCVLQPALRMADRAATGSISGRLTDGVGNALPGALVLAETEGFGQVSVRRGVLTGADGSYLLDLLPTSTILYVVSQPHLSAPEAGIDTFETQASGPLEVGAGATVRAVTEGFVPASPSGTVSVTVTHLGPGNWLDQVDLLQSLILGGTSHTFVVSTTRTSMWQGFVTGVDEMGEFSGVAPGDYRVQGQASAILGGGLAGPPSFQMGDAFTVTPGSTARVTLGF